MTLTCGCVSSRCCGICIHANAVGRPRLTRGNAAQWTPPDLNKLRGAKHKAAREADVLEHGLAGDSFAVANGRRTSVGVLDSSNVKMPLNKGKRKPRFKTGKDPVPNNKRASLHADMDGFLADLEKRRQVLAKAMANAVTNANRQTAAQRKIANQWRNLEGYRKLADGAKGGTTVQQWCVCVIGTAVTEIRSSCVYRNSCMELAS